MYHTIRRCELKRRFDMQEVWKTIDGFENYMVSNLGNVKSVERTVFNPKSRSGVAVKKELQLKPNLNHKGYLVVKLYNNNKSKSVAIHRLVAKAFIPNPDNLPQVNHKDENKTNNNVENLEWCTNDYNIHYGTIAKRLSEAIRNSEAHKAYSKRRCKKVAQIDESGNIIEIWNSVVSVSTKGFYPESVIACCKGRKQTYKGYKWQYI